MSAIITGRVFWTIFPEMSYFDKKGKLIHIKEATAKLVMLAISDSCDDFGENSWQSFQTIADKASIDRRSVIRVVRALIGIGILKIAGITKYGTNNFSITTNMLGYPPTRRAKVGRPKTSDSVTEIGDSVSETSDPVPPYPLINPSLNPPAKRGDLVDGYLDLAQSPGIKKAARIDSILSYIGGRLHINAETKRWRDFAKFADERQQLHGEKLNVFFDWMMGQKNFDLQYWPPSKMTEQWPRAFFVGTDGMNPQGLQVGF